MNGEEVLSVVASRISWVQLACTFWNSGSKWAPIGAALRTCCMRLWSESVTWIYQRLYQRYAGRGGRLKLSGEGMGPVLGRYYSGYDYWEEDRTASIGVASGSAFGFAPAVAKGMQTPMSVQWAFPGASSVSRSSTM